MARVTLESIDQKIDDLKELVERVHKEFDAHTGPEHRQLLQDQILPLQYFKVKAYTAMATISVILSFLGWDYIRRLFIVEVLK